MELPPVGNFRSPISARQRPLCRRKCDVSVGLGWRQGMRGFFRLLLTPSRRSTSGAAAMSHRWSRTWAPTSSLANTARKMAASCSDQKASKCSPHPLSFTLLENLRVKPLVGAIGINPDHVFCFVHRVSTVARCRQWHDQRLRLETVRFKLLQRPRSAFSEQFVSHPSARPAQRRNARRGSNAAPPIMRRPSH